MNPQPGEAFKDAQESWRALRDSTLDSWAKTTMDFANTDAYAQAMGLMLDSYLTATIPIKRWTERYAADTLNAVNIPTRQEVTSLAERLTHIEMRLDDMDIQLDTLLRSMQQLLAETRSIKKAQEAEKTAAAPAQVDAEIMEKSSTEKERRSRAPRAEAGAAVAQEEGR